MNLRKVLNWIVDSYLLVVLMSLLFGVLLSKYVIVLAPYVSVFLGTIFFLSILKIDMKDLYSCLHETRMLIMVNAGMLIILPLVVFYVTSFVMPKLAIAFLILAAMPSGMTTPLLSEITGGKQGLALVFVVTTSFLAPITIPFVVSTLVGTAVSVSFLAIFMSIGKVIFIPFIIAQIVKKIAKKQIELSSFTFKPVSVILLSFILAGVVSKYADLIIGGFKAGVGLRYLVLLFIFFIVLHVIGYFTVFWRKRKDRITVTVSMTYMNTTLAIYLVDQFFSEPAIVIPVILSVIPWALLLIPYKWEMMRLEQA